MENAIRSAVDQAVEKIAACLGSLPPAPAAAASSSSSSSSSIPNWNDMEKMREEANRLIRMQVWIRATVDDAENMEVTDESVRYWLRELQGVADAAEDLLDEIQYEAMRLGSMEDDGLSPRHRMGDATRRAPNTRKTAPQVCHSSSTAPSHEISAFLYDVGQRMQKINSRFNEIKEYKLALSLEERYGQRRVETHARQPTSSFIQESDIFGRGKDLEIVKRFLLSDAESSRSNSIPLMAIVGMGGLGKTTLAQLAYNDHVIDKHFQRKSWVCVSENFDVVWLTKAMVESFSHKAFHISGLDPLQVNLKRRLSRKRFLLVLDDVWEEENLSGNWDQLTAPLRGCSAGSKIVITTRSVKVSKLLGATLTYHLPCLQDGDCLKLFSQRAFDGRDPKLYQNLMHVGRKISKKCKGLPLAAKTLGGLLRCEDDEQMWNRILESEVWNSTMQGYSIMPILRLSYRNLPAHLKRCFSYCSVFPKDHEFDRDQLICMWMAHGYIKAEGRELMEDVGRKYFDDLLSRSFFEYSQDSKMFLMHDLIHDLARCTLGEEWYSVEDGKSCHVPRRVRHFSIVATGDPSGSTISTKGISEPECLRSFLLIGAGFRSFGNVKLLNDSFTRMEHLRVLDLNAVWFFELPESITLLKHLRYLGLRKNSMEQLPESMGSLYHLQTLHFGSIGSHAKDFPERLPNSITNLLKLRHLMYKENVVSVEYPIGIGKLNDLQTMPGFHVSQEHDRADLGELKDMNNIRGRLTITGISNVTDVNEAEKACLDKKRSICSLHLKWNHWSDPSPIDDNVLENLKPSSMLEDLYISCFKGPSHSSWLGDQSFSKLSTVKLDRCRNWTFLPPLGQLLSLKSLSISAAAQVHHIGHEFFSGGFPQLETLTLEEMYKWKSWCGAQKGECPQLKRLHVRSCKNLESLSVINLDALQHLSIGRCPLLQLSPGSLQLRQLPSLQDIQIEGIYRVQHIDGDFSLSGLHIPLEKSRLELASVGQLEAFYVLGECFHLRQLSVIGHLNCTSLPLDNQNALEYVGPSDPSLLGNHFFYKLVSVKLDQCKNWTFLPPLGQLPSLKWLFISTAMQVHYIGREFFSGGFPKLERLILEDMDSWKSWCGARKGECPQLQNLQIKRCKQLQSLSIINLDCLQDLHVEKCPQLQFSSSSLQIWQLTSLQNIYLKDIYRVGHIDDDFSYFQLTKPLFKQTHRKLMSVGQLEEFYALGDCSFLRRHSSTGCSNLTSLLLGYQNALEYVGPPRPSSLGDHSFCNLANIKLGGCQNWTSFPPLGQLPSLKSLFISAAMQVQYIGREFFSGGFLKLVTLRLEDMDSWRSWCGAQKGECTQLRQLHIERCKHLQSLSISNLGALQGLHIEKCPQLQFSSCSLQIRQLPSLQRVYMRDIYREGLIDGDFSYSRGYLPRLEAPRLELERIGPLEILYVLGACSHICRLTVTGCSNLASLPLGNLNALKYVGISECPQLSFSSCSLQLRQLPSLQEIDVRSIHGVEHIYGLFSHRGTQSLETSSLQLKNVDYLQALHILDECSHIRKLLISSCANLTSLPFGNLDALEYFAISECPLFQFLNVEQISPSLQVICIDRCCSVTEWCKRHRRQRLVNLRRSEIAGEDNLYLVLRNVLNVQEAANFCSLKLNGVRILELEWDCCINIRSNADAAVEKLLEKLRSWMVHSRCYLDTLVIRGYMGSRFSSWLWDPSFRGLLSITLLQCSQCEILPPLGQLPFLMKLYVEGASKLEHVGREFSHAGGSSSSVKISFPYLRTLEFHNMPIWKEWNGTKEGDFSLLSQLVLKHCPILRALPHLPKKLKELELEACEELTSLSSSDSSTQGLLSLECLRRLSLKGCPKLEFAASERLPSTLQHMAVTHCPLLLIWCYGHLNMLAHIPVVWFDGIRVCTGYGKSISSQTEET